MMRVALASASMFVLPMLLFFACGGSEHASVESASQARSFSVAASDCGDWLGGEAQDTQLREALQSGAAIEFSRGAFYVRRMSAAPGEGDEITPEESVARNLAAYDEVLQSGLRRFEDARSAGELACGGNVCCIAGAEFVATRYYRFEREGDRWFLEALVEHEEAGLSAAFVDGRRSEILETLRVHGSNR